METFLNTFAMIVIIIFIITLLFALIIINIKLADNYKYKASLNNSIFYKGYDNYILDTFFQSINNKEEYSYYDRYDGIFWIYLTFNEIKFKIYFNAKKEYSFYFYIKTPEIESFSTIHVLKVESFLKNLDNHLEIHVEKFIESVNLNNEEKLKIKTTVMDIFNIGKDISIKPTKLKIFLNKLSNFNLYT